jgi:hypothetical protein
MVIVLIPLSQAQSTVMPNNIIISMALLLSTQLRYDQLTKRVEAIAVANS